LDIGTGCGELVRVLREKGCIAYGMDISEYAVANSHGNVVLGSVTDIPFKDNSFDVVHSQGLWEYVKEEDIEKAWMECNRVGKIQVHNIDTTGSVVGEEGFVTNRTKEWWDEKLKLPKVLVTCPTYDGKAYCFDEWVKMAKSLTYPNYDIFVVDNSKTEDFYNKYKDQIPMARKTFRPDEKDDGMYRVCQSMAEVQKYFVKGNYTHWMNIEADNIPPANIIETLMKYSGGDADWVSHGYPALPGSQTIVQGIGCSLLSRRLMTDFDWSNTSIADDSPDAELWNWVKGRGGYKTCELWYITDVKHLK
jgi:ubiquinone/menaquinone biosynthesis C-methylase UbiE